MSGYSENRNLCICAGKWRVNYRYSLHGYRISRFIFQLRNSCE
ncbi:hypothetical protein HMPREF1617_00436 [Escherichia coli 908675]|uniref:Uncharacterized protein n=1 Tax=Klebsiella pneumoniae TaxID=573 RepID=A0A6H1Q424_KLEPN|nr:hypothetical protein HMPREF9536_05797 [Escherichia coli MS 84-1]EFK65729.1 hypothetical protein HMPREF9347_05414 [Escherichia coli MS 124-1]EFU44500.1 hypothetical protein HMPREF9539_04991 [Escherichia coli MS 110-3]EFU55631.1 hypothetical protein HMPREF9545_04619 [Escherichia coli MS 16-3]EGB86820.1 hypothetical protein HMPREF9542_03742 [Escherichia coli MS 117-3]ESD12886.1 hypothetical protein HMPREF1590_00041 [Escherichia coli 113302]ESD24612.1 hypothetical protein HMPREF1598_01590 [Esc